MYKYKHIRSFIEQFCIPSSILDTTCYLNKVKGERS